MMNKLLKKVMAGALSASLLLGLAACTGSKESTPVASDNKEDSSKQVTLKLWHIWASDTESSKVPFEKVLADLQKDNPNIKLEVDATENEAYKTKIRTTVAANEAPDIFFYWSGGYMKGFVDAGKLLPLNDYLNDGTKDKLLDGTLSNMTFDDKVYGLPHTMAVGTFFVNEELFAKYNIKVPTTYDELVSACKAFRDAGVSTPMAVGGKEAWCIDMYLDVLQLRSAGYSTCFDALSGKGTFEDAGIIEGAKKLQELVDIGAFGDSPMSISRDESEVPFYNGEIPMYLNGSWTIGNIQKDSSKVKDKIKIYPFPACGDKSDLNDFTGGVSEIFVINANTKYKTEAVTALKYIAENSAREMYLAGVGLPAWKLNGIDESKIDPLTKQLVELTGSAKTFTLWWNTYLEGADSELYMNKSAELFAKKITPEKYAKDLQTMNED
jgi:raffinose/stachyose/melibiose transport system substrate-binding protein